MTRMLALAPRLARCAAVSVALAGLLLSTAAAAEVSRCLAVARAPWIVPPVPVVKVAETDRPEVLLTFVTHATFRIETPAGLVIATDYAGVAGRGRLPDVVTMNHAHETHYTMFPDPGITHVLRGWNPDGDGPARHHLKAADALIRNVPTDIRGWDGGREPHGNSIFIVETADLCIGHLGHLHHELEPDDLAAIGQLDIVLAPVDGTWTLDHDSMAKTLKVLKARVVVPMHIFGVSSLQSFLERMGQDFVIDRSGQSTLPFSTASLPAVPTIVVMNEAISGWSWD